MFRSLKTKVKLCHPENSVGVTAFNLLEEGCEIVPDGVTKRRKQQRDRMLELVCFLLLAG